MAEVGTIQPGTGKPRLVIASHLLTEVDGRQVNWFANEAENLRWKHTRTPDGDKARSEWGDQPKDAIDALTYILEGLPTVVAEAAKFQDMGKLATQIPKDDLPDYV